MDLKSLQNSHRTLSVDRITDNLIFCEDIHSGELFKLSLDDLDISPREGDILIYDHSGLKIDYEATDARKKYINSLFDELFGE